MGLLVFLPSVRHRRIFPSVRIVLLTVAGSDFTFVCPTEILAFNDRAGEFAKLNCQVIGASVDSEYTHLAWVRGSVGSVVSP